MSRKYLILLILSFVPQLGGCILQDFSLRGDGSLDIDVEPVERQDSEE
jgi:hypothetical protein